MSLSSRLEVRLFCLFVEHKIKIFTSSGFKNRSRSFGLHYRTLLIALLQNCLPTQLSPLVCLHQAPTCMVVDQNYARRRGVVAVAWPKGRRKGWRRTDEAPELCPRGPLLKPRGTGAEKENRRSIRCPSINYTVTLKEQEKRTSGCFQATNRNDSRSAEMCQNCILR